MNLFPPNFRFAVASAIVVSVAAVGVLAYWPAVGNSFISDDFTMIPFVRLVSTHPGQLLEVPSEIFRVVSYAYFWVCLSVFGPTPEHFYWTGIALHILVSLLVGRLVFVLTHNTKAAWAAALFFAAYERHQEAVMWISAVNDTLVTLFCIVFLLLWERAISDPEKRWVYRISLAALLVALGSKEASVSMVPLAALLMVFRDRPWREIAHRSLPLLLMLAGYVSLWLFEADRNFFLTDGHYALGPHFIPIFTRSVLRILSPALLFLIPLALISYRRSNFSRVSGLLRDRPAMFFIALLALTIVPYSFLTYLDHIPSRNSYLPSVGLAALARLLFAALYEGSITRRSRTSCVALLVAVVCGNVGYIWLKKDPQFKARAAPTRELISSLNGPEFRAIAAGPIHVCGFPLHVSIGRAAVEGFTPFGSGRIAFLETCRESLVVNALDWNSNGESYAKRVSSAQASEEVP
jgi:hypothetical protein